MKTYLFGKHKGYKRICQELKENAERMERQVIYDMAGGDKKEIEKIMKEREDEENIQD